MSAVTLYVRDQQLWDGARKASGRQGLSSLVERALRQHLQEPQLEEGDRRFVLTVGMDDDGGDGMGHSIEFQGQLITDSAGFSVEQLPRIRVYRTVKGRLVVYRTWPWAFQLAPSYSVYSDLDGLESDSPALATSWITEDDPLGERADLTADLLRSLRKALARRSAIAVDALGPSELAPARCQTVRLGRDTQSIRRALEGTGDLDVLTVAMHLLGASTKDPKHLSEIENAFRELKPVSRLGNTPDDLREFQAGMRGYLNNDTRKRAPSQRLFVNPRRGFWGLSSIADRRAAEVLRRLRMAKD